MLNGISHILALDSVRGTVKATGGWQMKRMKRRDTKPTVRGSTGGCGPKWVNIFWSAEDFFYLSIYFVTCHVGNWSFQKPLTYKWIRNDLNEVAIQVQIRVPGGEEGFAFWWPRLLTCWLRSKTNGDHLQHKLIRESASHSLLLRVHQGPRYLCLFE